MLGKPPPTDESYVGNAAAVDPGREVIGLLFAALAAAGPSVYNDFDIIFHFAVAVPGAGAGIAPACEYWPHVGTNNTPASPAPARHPSLPPPSPKTWTRQISSPQKKTKMMITAPTRHRVSAPPCKQTTTPQNKPKLARFLERHEWCWGGVCKHGGHLCVGEVG